VEQNFKPNQYALKCVIFKKKNQKIAGMLRALLPRPRIGLKFLYRKQRVAKHVCRNFSTPRN